MLTSDEVPVYYRGEKNYEEHAYQYATTSQLPQSMQPRAIIYINCDDDILKCLRYAHDRKISVAIRSGGHSYCGASSTSGDNIQIDLSGKEFKGDRSDFPYSQLKYDNGLNLFTMGVGATLGEVSDKLHSLGLFISHGMCPNVHTGGHSQTGGFTAMAATMGCFVDYIQSYTVIMADGTKRVIERNSNIKDDLDLFYAIAGGSPGNLVVVTHITVSPKRDEDYTIHGCKITLLYSKERLRKILIFQSSLNDPECEFGSEFCMTLNMIQQHTTSDDTLDEEMRIRHPKLLGSSESTFYPMSGIGIIALVVRKGKNLPTTPTIRRFFRAIKSSYIVFGRVDNFGVVDPRHIPPYVLTYGYGLTPSKEKVTIFQGTVKSKPEVNYSDKVYLKPNGWGPQTVSWWNIQRTSKEMWTGVREYPRPFMKAGWMADPGKTFPRRYFADWLTEHVDSMVRNKSWDGKVMMQLVMLRTGTGANPDLRTAYQHRDQSAFLELDVFYNPNKQVSIDAARNFMDQSERHLVGPKGFFSIKERLSFWTPSFEKNNVDQYWDLYFDSREEYERVLEVKLKVDPNHILTPNLFGVGGSLKVLKV